MKYTLLELVQRILESMESDEVNSISDTVESTAVANIIKECYFDIIGHFDPEETHGLFRLDASGDGTKPVLMTVPSNVSTIDWVKYNKNTLANPEMETLRYVDNEEFLYFMDPLDPAETNIDSMTVTVNGESVLFKFYNDRPPTYYTVFDESSVIFDAYDSDEEATLTESRSLGYGSLIPVFTLSDEFIPDLDPRQFQLLLQDAKATAFVELKQTQNAKAESKARRNAVTAQKNKNDTGKNGSSRQKTYTFGRHR